MAFWLREAPGAYPSAIRSVVETSLGLLAWNSVKRTDTTMQRRLTIRLLYATVGGGVMAGALSLGVASANHGLPHGRALGQAKRAEQQGAPPATVMADARTASTGTGASAGPGQGPGRGRGVGQTKAKGAPAGQAGPASQAAGPVKNASGELTAVGGSAPGLALTVKTVQAGEVKVVTAGSTVFRGPNHKNLRLPDLANLKGRMVNVHGRLNTNGELVATQIIVRPEGSGVDDD